MIDVMFAEYGKNMNIRMLGVHRFDDADKNCRDAMNQIDRLGLAFWSRSG